MATQAAMKSLIGTCAAYPDIERRLPHVRAQREALANGWAV